MRTIGVFGISGVGKSTLIRRAGDRVPLLHLQASDLIKSRLGKQSVQPSSEELRQGRVLDNQRLMIDEFLDRVSKAEGIVVFDGHTIVDAPTGLIEVPLSVFKELKLDEIVFIEDVPETIAARRATDTSRARPDRDPDLLRQHQDLAKARSIAIADALGIPIHIITAEDWKSFLAIVEP